MMYLQWFIGLAFVAVTQADYPCLCNYDVELEVYETMSLAAPSFGMLYEFDCKEQLVGKSTDPGWGAIAFEHQIGYVKFGNNTKKQLCPGDAPDTDTVPTSSVPMTSSILPDTTTTPLVEQTTSMHITTVMPDPKTTTTASPVIAESTTQGTKPTTSTQYMPTISSTSPQTEAPTTHMMTTSTVPSTTASTSTLSSTSAKTEAPTTHMMTTSTVPSTTSSTTTSTPSTTTSSTTIAMSTTTTTAATTTTSATVPVTSRTTHITTSTQKPLITGKTSLCPVALQSFAAQDGGILTQYDQSCYEIVPHRQSWTYAERDCKTKGGHLLHIASSAEQNYIYNFLQTHYNHNVWIGLTDQRREGDFEWASGDLVSYTHWQPGMTNHQDCAYMNPHSNGNWMLRACAGSIFFNNAYICQYEIDTTSPLSGNVSPHGEGNYHMCPSSVQNHASRYHGILGQYGQSCYELLPRYVVTWSHGENLCRQEGGHLVHISNADEQSFIQEFTTNHLPDHAVWIGLNDRTVENSFVWSSGNPVTYTNWAKDHANNFASHHAEDCAVFKPYQNGHWDDVPCGRGTLFGDAGETHTLMCQFKVSTSPETGGIIG